MFHVARMTTILVCATSLMACTSYGPEKMGHYQNVYEAQNYSTYNNNDYSYYTRENPYPPDRKQVVVPETYHVGTYRSPTSHKDLDRQWVQNQSPNAYTIELADGDKPAQVAGKMQKAPKGDRSAQIKYERGGRAHYKGLYGTYNNYEAAQQALSALPPEAREGASIKPWGTVQSTVSE